MECGHFKVKDVKEAFALTELFLFFNSLQLLPPHRPFVVWRGDPRHHQPSGRHRENHLQQSVFPRSKRTNKQTNFKNRFVSAVDNQMFQYFITVVPTKLNTYKISADTHQFSVTERVSNSKNKNTSEPNTPGF